MKSLFNHKKHTEGFKKTGVTCTDCHTFSVKATSQDPLGSGVDKAFLKPNRKTCHECHLGKVELPRPNQCTLCHSNPLELKPSNHSLSWKTRHGTLATSDPDSCKACHTQNSCNQCHSERNFSKPIHHRANFRLTHSIEARVNPRSCSTCHSSTSLCIQCHTKGLQ